MTTKITQANTDFSVTEWQSVKTASFTAVAGEGYFVDTTSTAITVTLPASPSAGDVVVLKDYARTWGTNAVTTSSALVDGVAAQTPSFSTSGQTVTLVYMDGTKGWSLINEDTTTGLGVEFISATGGTVTTSGDYKIHTFTGDGCFVVSATAPGPSGNPNTVDYLVVAGGGAGGSKGAGGGGAGGFRESHSTCNSGPYTASPLATPTGITVSATTYPITVGAGGAGTACVPVSNTKAPGSNSVFSTITSTGGGGGGTGCAAPSPTGNNPVNNMLAGDYGGSGGGVFDNRTNCAFKGVGNSPPVSPPQGNPGGRGVDFPPSGGGGGGGAGGAGANATTPGSGPSPSNKGGNGGAGVTTSITGSSLLYSAGGGGGLRPGGSGGGDGGSRPSPRQGGSGAPHPSPDTSGAVGQSGVANTGGGGGGGSNNAPTTSEGGSGGKGVVVIRYKFQ